MNELEAILDSWRETGGTGGSAVLATVVEVSGSAYRRPGARMLMLPDGRRIGSISGGCLEGEIARKAWWFTEAGTPVVRVYDTTSDDDAVWEFGLGCNGVVHVLLERASSAPVREMFAFLGSRKPCVVATVIRARAGSGLGVGDRLLLDEAGDSHGIIHAEVRAQAEAALKEKKSRLLHLTEADVFVEWVGPPQSLVIFGAGHDAIPVTAIARQLGWCVTVADGRPAYAVAERFPDAERVVLLSADDLLEGLTIDSETAVVVMTHNYPLDSRLLARILPLRPRYLGILGPKNRAERLFAELGLPVPEEVGAPTGLDIGTDTPAAIALSIVSEIQSALSGRMGGPLRNRMGSIHAPTLETGAGGLHHLVEAVRPSYCETGVGNA
jgi:xanthine dehydrogenase accessory factor